MATRKPVATQKNNKRPKHSDDTAETGNYPHFIHGNVYIHFAGAQVYRLHRDVLTRNCNWFKRQIQHIEKNKKDSAPQYYVFDLAMVEGGCDVPTLRWNSLAKRTPSIDLTESDADADNTTSEAQKRSMQAHDYLFRVMYNCSPQISHDSIEDAFVQCADIMYLAQGYCCAPLVRPMLFARLCEFRHSLYEAISTDPVKWLNLSVSLQSGLIFSEAAIHCIGGFPDYGWRTPMTSIVPEAQALICRKASQLLHWTMKIDMALMINTLKDDDGDPVNPSSTTESWLVVSMFQDWLRSQLQQRRAIRSKSRAFYKMLATGGDAYLPVKEVVASLETVLDSSGFEADDEDTWDDVTNDLEALKNHASKEVMPLLKSKLTLDAEVDVPYLTCMDVKPADYPWNN